MEQKLTIAYEYFTTWKELSEIDQSLIVKAFEACETAYAPYSNFRVGASIQLSDGTILKGSNQENVAYPSGLCAERVALFYAGANFPNEKVDTLCIVAKGDLLPMDKILSPCGGCRQVMLETENRQKRSYRILLVNQDDTVTVFQSAHDLLPLAFGV